MRLASLACFVALGACGFSLSTGSSVDANGSSDGSGTGSDGDIDPDAPIDTPLPDGLPGGWHTPVPLGITGVDDPTLTGDLLQIWFDLGADIYHASRQNTTEAFGPAMKVTELSTSGTETTPEVTADGLTITFGRTTGNSDLYISTWDGNLTSWTTPVPIYDLDTTDHEQAGTLSDDRLMIAMTRYPPGGASDIYVSTRSSDTGMWTNATPEIELNTMVHDGSPFLSGDKLTVCFDTQRLSLQHDIFCAKRVSATVPFSPPIPMTDINSPASDQDPWLSPSGKVMVFWSDRDGTGKLWYAIHD